MYLTKARPFAYVQFHPKVNFIGGKNRVRNRHTLAGQKWLIHLPYAKKMVHVENTTFALNIIWADSKSNPFVIFRQRSWRRLRGWLRLGLRARFHRQLSEQLEDLRHRLQVKLLDQFTTWQFRPKPVYLFLNVSISTHQNVSNRRLGSGGRLPNRSQLGHLQPRRWNRPDDELWPRLGSWFVFRDNNAQSHTSEKTFVKTVKIISFKCRLPPFRRSGFRGHVLRRHRDRWRLRGLHIQVILSYIFDYNWRQV